MNSVTHTYNPELVERTVKHFFADLPDEHRDSPEALVDWAITNTLKQVAAAKATLSQNVANYDPVRMAGDNPDKTGHEIIEEIMTLAGA